MSINFEPYIPEQIIDYFEPISGLTVQMYENYLLYVNEGTAVVVGYPIYGEYCEEGVARIVQKYLKGEKKNRIVVIAPKLPSSLTFEEVKSDNYYRLTLPIKLFNKKIRYMVSRASRELTVEAGRSLTRNHRQLMENFLNRPDVEEFMEHVCNRLDYYLSRSKTVKIINAFSKKGRLAGFDVVDFPAGRYSFYMFNFIDRSDSYVPGVSDLMLYHFLKISEEEGKWYVNMGLGINEGVERFKRKWGAKPFLSYQYGVLRCDGIPKLFEMLSRL